MLISSQYTTCTISYIGIPLQTLWPPVLGYPYFMPSCVYLLWIVYLEVTKTYVIHHYYSWLGAHMGHTYSVHHLWLSFLRFTPQSWLYIPLASKTGCNRFMVHVIWQYLWTVQYCTFVLCEGCTHLATLWCKLMARTWMGVPETAFHSPGVCHWSVNWWSPGVSTKKFHFMMGFMHRNKISVTDMCSAWLQVITLSPFKISWSHSFESFEQSSD